MTQGQGGQPQKKGLSPIAWIAIGCAGMLVVVALAMFFGGLFIFNKARDVVQEMQDDPVLATSAIANADGRLGLNGADQPAVLPDNAFQVDCSTVVEGHSDYRKKIDVMQDMTFVLKGDSSDQIPGRTQTIDRNTYHIGPQPEEDDLSGDGD